MCWHIVQAYNPASSFFALREACLIKVGSSERSSRYGGTCLRFQLMGERGWAVRLKIILSYITCSGLHKAIWACQKLHRWGQSACLASFSATLWHPSAGSRLVSRVVGFLWLALLHTLANFPFLKWVAVTDEINSGNLFSLERWLSEKVHAAPNWESKFGPGT